MIDAEKLLANPIFEGKTISAALDHCVKQDPKTPQRFLIRRAQLQDDEALVRELAGNPDVKEGLWRMHHAERINCTCEAVALHFTEFDDIRDVVIGKSESLFSKSR